MKHSLTSPGCREHHPAPNNLMNSGRLQMTAYLWTDTFIYPGSPHMAPPIDHWCVMCAPWSTSNIVFKL